MAKKLRQREWMPADLLVLDDESPYDLADVGELHREQGRFREAEICFRKSAELIDTLGHSAYDRLYAYLELGRVLREAGKADEAEEWLRRAEDISNGIKLNAGTRYLIVDELAKTLVAQGKNAEAAPVLAEAEARNKEFLRVVTAHTSRKTGRTGSGPADSDRNPDASGIESSKGHTQPGSKRNPVSHSRNKTGTELWDKVFQRPDLGLKLPLPDAFEQYYVAVVAQADEQLTQRNRFQKLRRCKAVQAEIPTLGAFVHKEERAKTQPFLRAAVDWEKRTGSPTEKRTPSMSVRSAAEEEVPTLKMTPAELLAGICRTVISEGALPSKAQQLRELAKLLKVPKEVAKAFRIWLTQQLKQHGI